MKDSILVCAVIVRAKETEVGDYSNPLQAQCADALEKWNLEARSIVAVSIALVISPGARNR